MQTKLLQTLFLGLAFGLSGCGPSDSSAPVTGGASGNSATGGNGSTSNAATGGTTSSVTGGNTDVPNGGNTVVLTGGTGGSDLGGNTGASNGGTTRTSGSDTGGAGMGGIGTGGTIGTGGATTGGMGSGGRVGTGGAGTGGMGSGGRVGTGGATGVGSGGRVGTGGAGTGGMGSGGRVGTGGTATGGTTTSGTSSSCTPATVPSNGTSHCSSNQSGTAGNLQWTVWSSGSGGCLITYGSGTAFSATWNNSGNFLARVGLSLGSNKTYDKFGTITADFAETKSGTAGGWSDIGVYGWTVNPLIEFYIVEDWFTGRPGGTKKGTFTIEGEGTYDVYTATRTNQPSIQGTATFEQYFSVRQTQRQCGHMTLTKHFDQWKSLGLNLGNMYEAKILLEVGGGSGRADFTTAAMTAQ